MTAKILPVDAIKREMNIVAHKGKKGMRLLVTSLVRSDELVISWGDTMQMRLSARAAKDYAHVLTHMPPNQPMKFRTNGYNGDTLTIEKSVELDKDSAQTITIVQSGLNKTAGLPPMRLTSEQTAAHAAHVLEVVAFLAEQEADEKLELAP